MDKIGDQAFMVYYIGIVTGALVLLGALVILGLGKIYVDVKTGEVIEFSLPILGKIKTRSPLIFFAGIGFSLIIICSKMAPLAPPQELIAVDGTIDTASPVTVYFIAVPGAEYHQQASGDLHTSFPKLNLENAQYRAEFVVGDQLVDDVPLKVVKGHVSLTAFTNSGTDPKSALNVVPQIKVSDAEAKAFLK